jgi:hypothetical protein
VGSVVLPGPWQAAVVPGTGPVAPLSDVDAAFMQLGRYAVCLLGYGRATHSRKPYSDHTGTVSITIRVRRASWNVMKPWIQGVLTL